MRHKDTIETLRSIEMYFCGLFQTDVLINFFIPLGRTEAITYENLVHVNFHM